MHIRRALLLFAIVLGLAAIAASVSRTSDDSGEREAEPALPSETQEEPSVSPGATPVAGSRELVFDADRDQTRQLVAGEPATVFVEVDEPGLVEIPNLGLSAPAQPLTPARFDVLPPDPGRLAITFTPAADDATRPAGTLVVRTSHEG